MRYIISNYFKNKNRIIKSYCNQNSVGSPPQIEVNIYQKPAFSSDLDLIREYKN
jgi:hypothetical protein